MAHEGHDHDHDHHDGHDDHGEHGEHGDGHVATESVASFARPGGDGVGGRGKAGRPSRILHVDPISGVAGDMLIAAFVDLGVDRGVIERAAAAVALEGVRLEFGRRDRHAIAAGAFEVHVEADQPPRDYAAIASLLERAPLDERVRTLARRAFLRLGEAEAKIHRQPLARVHFHEVGGVDAIVDVVGASAAIAALEAEAGGEGALALSVGALPLGGGRARGAHGSIPVPAPAALELLIGLPVRDAAFAAGVEAELVTPTGAALIRAFSELLPSTLGGWPSFVPIAVGYGAGRKDLADRANVVRLVLGHAAATSRPFAGREASHVVLEANVDDATAEVAAVAIERLLAEGALDAWAQPITMKKGRPAFVIGAIGKEADADRLGRVLLAETGSLGVRRSAVDRLERPRRFVDVATRFGAVRVKVADGDGLPPVVHPELEVCRMRAHEHGVPVREVIRAAIAATTIDG
jgi:uncharacterized protein (TIGR00299 family) protein